MLKILFVISAYLLATYGVLCLATSVINSINHKIKFGNSGIRLVLMVKNQEGSVEGVVRSIFANDFLRMLVNDKKLIVLDMGSDDETVSILNKLKDDFEYLDIIMKSKKEEIFEYFEKND